MLHIYTIVSHVLPSTCIYSYLITIVRLIIKNFSLWTLQVEIPQLAIFKGIHLLATWAPSAGE